MAEFLKTTSAVAGGLLILAGYYCNEYNVFHDQRTAAMSRQERDLTTMIWHTTDEGAREDLRSQLEAVQANPLYEQARAAEVMETAICDFLLWPGMLLLAAANLTPYKESNYN